MGALISFFVYLNKVSFLERNKVMFPINQTQIEKVFSQHLSSGENLVTIGLFKKVPPTSHLVLSKGLAWIFSKRFYVAVTDQRLIILPSSFQIWQEQNVILAGFDEVEYYQGLLSTTILDVQKNYQGKPLKLRFKPGYRYQGMDQFDFIAAVKQGKRAMLEWQDA